jgi:hypothetical protein
MKVLLATAVWGSWHIDAYSRVTLPTLLAKGNCPALARVHDCECRIFTTKESEKRLNNVRGLARLREIMPVDVRIIAPDDRLTSDAHLTAWQRAVDDAIAQDAAIVSVHPDTPWSDGSFAFMGRALNEGKDVFVVPNVRVISETFVPAIEALQSDETITLSGLDMSILALRHLHPLSACMVPQVGYSASATEIYWGVPGQGLSLRHASRPAIAAVPKRVPLDIEFYTRRITDLNTVCNITDVNQMFMLSLAPLFKDFGLMTPEHKATPLLLGRWCAHPQNDTPLKDYFAAQSLHLPIRRSDSSTGWRSAEGAADAFMDEVSVDLAAVNLHYVMRNQHCKTAAQLLALALHETELARRLRCPPLGHEGVVFVPNETAFAHFGIDRLAKLAAPECEKLLVELLLLHYQPDWSRAQAERALAEAGIAVIAAASTDRLFVLIIEQVLDSAL